ncbi:hypothetical protein [Stakelama pacifica]|uniref:Uncharacterized protein n=1 Tax=Stakelama pacifica TaxID=517720 RepID=A0A4R6FQI6_9SPHN|nr:hypothetical protein [Stakelama pacifica]TDN82985.1 hypothetical protein EV664_105183 [Stakelama pacifica]
MARNDRPANDLNAIERVALRLVCLAVLYPSLRPLIYPISAWLKWRVERRG